VYFFERTRERAVVDARAIADVDAESEAQPSAGH
jgi:hypothetical protein